MEVKERMLTDKERKLVEENHELIYKVTDSIGLDIEDCYDLFAISLCHAAQNHRPKRHICDFKEFAEMNMMYDYLAHKYRDYVCCNCNNQY